MLKRMVLEVSDRMWQLRDEIAELRKERKKLMMSQPLEQEDLDELSILDARLDELALEYEENERIRKELMYRPHPEDNIEEW